MKAEDAIARMEGDLRPQAPPAARPDCPGIPRGALAEMGEKAFPHVAVGADSDFMASPGPVVPAGCLIGLKRIAYSFPDREAAL